MNTLTQIKYPFGPLSLVQLDYFERAMNYPHNGSRPGEDAYDYGMRVVASHGIYPTFGHLDTRTRRWYRDLWGRREVEFGIPIRS